MGSKLYVLFKKKKRKKEKKRNDVKGWDMWLKKLASCHMHHGPKKRNNNKRNENKSNTIYTNYFTTFL